MERLFDERRCRMERLENDIVYVTVYLNNGYSFAGYLYKDEPHGRSVSFARP